jgi:sugar lactone lactonase YvrE
MGSRIHVLDRATGHDEVHEVGQPVGAVALTGTDGLLVAAVRDGLATFELATDTLDLFAPLEADDRETRFNDGKVDPAGRFWAGTMRYAGDRPVGSLYRLDPDGSVRRVLGELSISNGLDWSPDGRTMYLIDTPTGRVDGFDYDPESGAIANRRPVVVVPADQGYPDGMTVDAEGCLWVALWDGWAVQRYDPEGRLAMRCEMPVSQVSSCAFGGPGLDELYVTTASEDFTPERRVREPLAGGLFRLRPGVSGRLPGRFAAPTSLRHRPPDTLAS